MKHNLINTFSIDDLIAKIDKSINRNFQPTLAFIYLSVEYDIEKLVKKLKKYNFIIVGSTTVGEIFADGFNGAHTKDKSITCMLTNFDKSAFQIKLKKMKDELFFNSGKTIGKWASKCFDNLSLLTITAGLYFNNESYINGLQRRTKYFFGAVAGDDRYFKGTYVFSNNKIISNGILALAIDRDKIDIISSRGFGWSGIGTQRVVTKSNGNIVYTIDDKPALEFYKDYLNISASDMPNMGADYPMEVLLKNGQIVYRAAININEDGSLFFAGHIPEGSKVRISAPMGKLVVDEVRNSISESLLKRKDYIADLVLVFPCASHKALLGSFGTEQIQVVHEITNHSPLIGFYAYGEIASSEEENAFHNETFVTVQLREK